MPGLFEKKPKEAGLFDRWWSTCFRSFNMRPSIEVVELAKMTGAELEGIHIEIDNALAEFALRMADASREIEALRAEIVDLKAK